MLKLRDKELVIFVVKVAKSVPIVRVTYLSQQFVKGARKKNWLCHCTPLHMNKIDGGAPQVFEDYVAHKNYNNS